MRYVGGQREAGCVFCNRLAERNDPESLILWRGEHAFAIMNLFPYNTGHIMLVPNEHVAGPEDADPRALTEIAEQMPSVLRALRRALNCDGFNLGTNVGATAGAGIASHLHEHVVPRWLGDANFMPILATTMVMPELVPVTYAKLRAEIGRELGRGPRCAVAVVDVEGDLVLSDGADGLPIAEAAPDEPMWKAAIRVAREAAPDRTMDVCWAGSDSANGPIALGVSVDQLPGNLSGWIEPDSLSESGDRMAALRAMHEARHVAERRNPDR